MSQAGLSNRGMIGQMGTHHYLMDRLMQQLQSTGTVDERARSGRPLKTTPREDSPVSYGILTFMVYFDPGVDFSSLYFERPHGKLTPLISTKNEGFIIP